MKKIACLGTEAFTMGFRLAGIRKVVVINGRDALDKIHGLRKEKEIGVVIIDEEVLRQLDSHDRTEIEDAVEPVFITLSTTSESDAIRKLIIKSIGIDLWKGG